MINTLPKSLIEAAKKILTHNQSHIGSLHCVSNFHDGKIPIAFSLHDFLRTYSDHPEYFPLNESESSFHQWANETEIEPSKLPVDTYVKGDTELSMGDRRQMVSKNFDPMTHKELFLLHAKNLNEPERKVVHDYLHMGLRQSPQLSSGSTHINYHLLNASMANMNPNPHIKHGNGEVFDLHTMDRSIEKSKLPHVLTTYSGIGFDPSNISDSKQRLILPAFTSSSTRRFVAGKYAIQHGGEEHHILQIHNKVGDSGIYTGNNNRLSSFSDDEYILPRAEMFKMHDKNVYHHGSHKFHVWGVERIPKTNYFE